ncbi:MAG: diacylglycerol O-acyltransferase / wax synthase [Mycobacterium sp.]|jgi:WS/DGAT/MGAT family acyltransferase|nr:diacylglycerol O-acyltransferase / wax synthase [Mycobacterium sp.]
MTETAKRLSPLDMMFLYGETPSTMMHVGGLMPFTPPPGAPPDFLRRLLDDTKLEKVVSPWNRKLAHPTLLYRPDQAWVVDTHFDLDYHVRRSALASPGDERELGILVSRLHSNALDLRRPPWEVHFIEGLEGGRFALYMKMHHSLVDGYTATKILRKGMSTNPNDTDHPLFFNIRGPATGSAKKAEVAESDGNLLSSVTGAISAVGSAIGFVAGTGRSALDLIRALINTELRPSDEQRHLVTSFQAPPCILNNRISRNRRFATQQYKAERLKAIGSKQDATLNDVALSIIGGGLRAFLAELGELPDRSLIAFVPVNVRAKDDEGGGNAVGAMLAPLGTDIADPVERLDSVAKSTRATKNELRKMSRNAILAYSVAIMAPSGFQVVSALTGVRPPWPFAFNLCVSNVPGPKDVLYLRGSRMEANYPVSIPAHGMALNITLHSYADNLDFGFVGCRDTLPHLQRLAVYTGEALDELEAAT